MSQMAGFDFSVVTPRGRALTNAELEAEQQLLLEAARQAQWDSGPVPEQNLDIAPEAGAPIVLGPNALIAEADAAMVAPLDANGEPPLPTPDGAGDRRLEISDFRGEEASPEADRRFEISDLRGEEEPLPPVTAEAGMVDGFDFSNVTPAPRAADRRLEISDFKSEEKKEIKLPAPKPAAKPVTTPEAADGSDVKFDPKGPAFQFTGSLVMEPGTGPMAGLDGMVPAPARGPMATMPGVAEPVMNRSPRLVPSAGGQIVFDQSSPERFTQGVEEAFAAGILPQANYEKIKADEAKIFKVMDDRRKLEEKAQTDPKLLAVLQGLGRGGAMTVGAVAGAKAGAAGGAVAAGATGVGAPAIPIVAAVTGTAGAIVGGIGAGLGYDALYKKLGEHFEEYDQVMQAAELYPMHKSAGELTMAGLAVATSVPQAVRGLQTAYQAGGLPQAARTAGAAGGLGAGTGVVAYPIDAAVRGEEITPGGFAAAAGVGALTGGFFINNRMANAKDVAAVAAKMKAGQTLTAAETQLARAAQPEIAASIAKMDAAGGVRTGPLDVEVPVTSVVGLVPSAGRARVDLPFSVPARLPAGAVRAAQAKAEAPRLPSAASVPREAPVNVLPTGSEVIPMPGPAVAVSRAMLTPDAFVDAVAAERGLDMDFNPTATEELFAEHFELVKAAVSNNEPVSAAALDLYEMRVPYYVRNEETGVASFDEAAFRAYEDYLTGRDREFAQDMTEVGGIELLAAVIELGGLPSRQAARSRRSAWSGELEMLLQNAQGAGKGKGSDNQKGVFLNKLFRKDGKDLDDIVTGLRGKGFRVETPAELIEMLDVRLRTGNEVYGVPTQSMEDVPLEMRGARRTAGPAVPTGETPAPRVEDIKQAVTAVHAQAVAQSEGFLRDVTDAAAQSGGRAVEAMFPKAVKALDRAVTKVERSPKVPSDLLRATVEAPAGGPMAAQTTANQLIRAMQAKGYQIYAPGGKPDITDRHLDAAPGYKDIALKFVKDADGPDPIVKEVLVIQPAMLATKKAIHGFYKQVREIDRQLKNETRPEVIAMLKQASAQAEVQMRQLAAQAYEADLAGVPANQARRLAIQASASVQSSADISSTSSGKSGGVGMPLSSTERGLAFVSSLSMQRQSSTPGRAGQAAPRVEERPDLTLAAPDPQAYFDFSNVPASKQPAGNAAVQAAAQASSQPYQAPGVSLARGVAGDVGLADARARQAAAYRALLGGDAAAVADAIKNGVPLSRLMLGYISREPATFNIKGAIIKSPQDLAMYNLAHRTPFFESLKIAVLDDRQQVIHSQVVSVGSLNESIAHPRDILAVAVAAQQANPKSKVVGFMIMHNHPSGQVTPSDADRAITRRFTEAGDMLGIPLLDHVITNGEEYFSFREHGLAGRNPTSLARANAKPRLPVLPAPEGEFRAGAVGEFEAVPSSEARQLRLGGSDKLKMVQATLQTADPNMIHVINVDTKYSILSVVRHPMDVRPADIIKSTTPQATYAMFVSLPNMPEMDARPLVRRIREAADLMQIFLLDASMPGMPDTFKEMGLLEQPDAPYATERKVAEVGPDPLTPPASVRSGGPAKVPPGTPVGMAAINPPDWVLARGETSAGRRLIKGIENFRPGQRWGFRSIVDFVNEAVRLEMRRSTSQTTRTHPAHYKPAHHMAYTRETQSQINFHEAGHGLEYLIRARVPDFFNAYADELLALANRPGSMASDAPTALSKEAQRQYRIGEGVAEWTRLLMVDPAAVQNLKVSAALSAAAERFYPGMAKSLRDGARAVNAFQAADVATRWAMFNAVPGANPAANELFGAIVRGGESAVNMIASGAPVSALDRKITRAIIKQRKETETAYGAAVKKARETRATNLTPLMSAYNMILSIGAETQLAISGQGISKGLRIVEDDGSFRYLTHETWRDLRKKVPATKLAQFDQAAWAKESLNRYENGGLEYPGMREGISPKDLKAIVAAAEREIPNFTALYKEQSRFHDLILEVKEAGGLISPVDRAMMQSARDGYWPLPRVMTAGRGRGGRGRGDISAGVFRARGSGEAIRNIDEVTEERTREMFEAYYWNRFGTKLYDNMLAVAKDKSLPAEARKLAGSTMVKLKMPMQSAAKVSKEEALGWVMKAIGDAYERALGFRPEVKAEDINLSWSFRDVWRPVKPTDVNVVSLLRDGKREYYQIGDPAMFALFSRPQEARAAGKFVSWAVGPMTENWKRNITQGLVFAVRNMFRDVFTQPMMNPDPVGWVPGWSHWKGAVNKWTQKYPQVFSEGLLLSRVEPSSSEMVNSVKHGAVWQWLTEGFYVSQAKDPIVRTLATVLNPSNFLFPLWKTVDLINLVTGGRTLAQFMETAGREGAAVAALERGATDEEALAKYWTAAGQFNEHAGNADARIMMRIPGFLNPMLQGLRNQVQKLTDPDPAVAGTTWLRLLAMMPVAFGGAAIVRYLLMDEQEKEKERQRPVDERMNFMDLGGFSIPFPFGVEGVMGSVIYNAAMDDLLSRPKVDADRTALMLLKRIADPGSALQFFGPQLATLQEANMNWSTFRQKHIVAPWMVNLPASEQYYSTTPEFYRKLGQMMNYSPAKLQYIVQQAISRQADETIRLAESMDRGRPIMEAADVPFVGRMFVRDPIGFGSQAVRSAAAVEDKLRLLDERLKSKGWHSLKDPEFPADKVGSVELRKLQVQLAYLEDLRKGLRVLSDMQGVGKYYTLARDYANERNVRTLQTQYTQSLLIGNRDRLAVLEQALDLVKQIPQAPPEQVAAEYLNRRF